MDKTERIFITAALLVTITGTKAQGTLQFDGSIPVERNSTQMAMPWAGGINYPQTSQIDLDQDGEKDLLFFDRTGNSITTLWNTAGEGTAGYTHTRAYDDVWPFRQLHDWVLLRDYDCDGKEDIFSYSSAGFSVYRNISTPDGLAFELLKFRVNCNYVFTDGSSQITNLYVSSEDLPGIADVDGDGDLDILTFSQLGSYVQYYKNLAMETYGTCDSLVFELRNACWGRFSEAASTNAITLNAPCPTQVPSPEIGGPVEVHGSVHDPVEDDRAAHAGSSVTPLDLDGNGVMDLLLGDISFNNLVGLTNGGDVDDSHMTAVDNAFPNDDISVDLPIFPAAFHLDLDKDGNRDLLVSPSARSQAHNFRGMWYYRNNGTDAAPSFEFQQKDLFQNRMLDMGEGAYPVPFDHNQDGLMDLIVSNEGYFDPNDAGNKIGAMALLQNTGTATEPGFRLITTDYMGLSTSGIGEAMYPAFADVDGDGDEDMFVGDLLGFIHFYRNTGSGPVAQFILDAPNIADVNGSVIDVGRHATPQFFDMDGDGLKDLIIGEQNGNLNHYRNSGTASAATWTFVTDSLGRVRTTDLFSLGHSVPFMYRNTDGNRELLVGSEAGWLWHYTGIEGNVGGAWTLEDSTYMGFDEGYRSSLCLYDYTGDGELDLIMGNYRGGLSFWRSDAISSVRHVELPPLRPVVQPNPTNGTIGIRLSEALPQGSNWSVFNSLGQVVLQFPVTGLHTVASLTGLQDGIYTIRATGTARLAVVRVVVASGR